MFNIRVFLSLVSVLLSVSLFAKPDLDFIDSGNYGGAYLKHELVVDDVKFVLSGPILDYSLPNKFYNVEALKSYIQRREFGNARLKNEFINMLDRCFSSKFKAKEFLDELLKVLNEFDQENVG